ncbi:CDP-glycerol glycerophosphotransferase family protein, partial [Halolactibacillus alkaliphilus]
MNCLINNYEIKGDSIIVTFSDKYKIEQHSKILLIKRKSQIEHTFKVSLDKFSKAYIDCDIFSTGIWDIYLLNADSKKIRSQGSDEVYSNAPVIYSSSEKNYNLDFYQTKNENVSIKVTALDLSVDLHKVKRNSQDIALSLKLDPMYPLENYDRNSSSIVLEPMNIQSNYIEIPANIEQLNGHYLIIFTLTKKNKSHLLKLHLGKWKVNLKYSINQVYRKEKIKILDDSLLDQTNDLMELNELIESYFYKTKNEFLGFEFKKAVQIRNIEHFDFDEDKIVMTVQSGLDVIAENSDLKTSFLLRNRYTGETFEDIHFTETKEKNFNSFKITIDLTKLQHKIDNTFTIFDAYARVQYKSYFFQKKLRFTEFIYYKDHYEKNTFFKQKNSLILFSQAYSPFGNIKLLTYKLSRKNELKLKYNRQISKVFSRNKDVWLIGERFDTAQDNGYHFFKYCRDNYPNLPIYYVIDTSSKDYNRIRNFGNVVKYGSDKHFNLLLRAKVFIGTHDFENILPVPGQFLDSFQQGIRIFLQHGVLGRKNVEYHKQFYKYPFHMFCVSSTKEKDLVKSIFGYDENEVKITGLSRFDSLDNTVTKKSILVMPTWREWLTDEKTFIESEYYKRYHSLLHHSRLQSLLVENNIHLEFYPHYRMQPYIQHFKSNDLKNISIVQLGEVTVQELIQRNNLMITDYSSVSFDFSYLNKPVLYYHFDFDVFFKNGILRDKSETFLGEISSTEDNLFNLLEDIIHRDFVDKIKTSDKRASLFNYIDLLNNKRIFDEIKSIV